MSLHNSFNDNELTASLKAGEELAFTEIYNRYWNKLYFLAHRNLKSSEASEEIVQDVFLILWRKRETLNIQSLPEYLAAMVRYAVYRYFAKEKSTRNQEAIFQMQSPENTSIDSEIENKLLLEIVSNLSNQLPEKCRLVFQCNKIQDMPLAEVAAQLDISQKTAEAHLTKALKIIRGRLRNALSVLF